MKPSLDELRSALANAGGIELRPPATEARVAAFESALGIALPPEHRAFVLQVCDGIAIDGEPQLYSLDDMLTDLAPPARSPGPSRDPSRPFLYDDAAARALRAAMDAAEDSLMEDKAFMSLQRQGVYEGCLTVGYNGGNDLHALVVTGQQRGAIWRTGEVDCPVVSDAEPGAPVGFVEWFVRWAPEALGIEWPWE
jgi:hypothetical protein